jgi:hypothetical protein
MAGDRPARRTGLHAVGKIVSVDDFALRPARGMTGDETFTTGKYRFRFHRSPHIPHGWDAGGVV